MPISGAYIYVSVITYSSKPESTLKKKCNAMAYHATCKSVAMSETLTGHIRSEDSLANLLTKVVTGQERKHIVSLVLYDIYDVDT